MAPQVPVDSCEEIGPIGDLLRPAQGESMTLIVTAGNAEYAVMAADTRLSWKGVLVDDASAKIAQLRFFDGVLISAYTGLARWGTFETRMFLLDALYKVAEPWKKTEEVLSLLRENITKEFMTNAELKLLAPAERKLSIVFAGFIDQTCITVLISNFEDHIGPFTQVADEFVLTKIRATDPSGSWCGTFGQRSAVTVDDIAELNRLIMSHNSPLPVKGKCHAMVLKAGPRSGGSVGPNILTATLPRGQSATSWYSTEGHQESIIMPDNFHALAAGGSAMMIRDVKLHIPNLTSKRPDRRGRKGKHQP